MKILVTGSSGLIGSTLNSFLANGGHQVYKLVRGRADLLADEVAWDPHRGVINPTQLEGFDVVVHLAGESLLGKWTEAKKKGIRESRVNSTRLLSQTLCRLRKPPSVFICASAIGYYGNRGEDVLTEQSSKGEGFLADVCEEWEEAARPAVEEGIRTINLRIGAVLSPKGGALKQMLPIFRWCIGGALGTGMQYMSWIIIDDLIKVIDYVMHQQRLAGPINVVSPHPVTNKEFTKTLGHVLHRPTFLIVPKFAVRLIFGQMGEELLLSSQKVIPKKLEESGFLFTYPHLEEALRHLCGFVA